MKGVRSIRLGKSSLRPFLHHGSKGVFYSPRVARVFEQTYPNFPKQGASFGFGSLLPLSH